MRIVCGKMKIFLCCVLDHALMCVIAVNAFHHCNMQHSVASKTTDCMSATLPKNILKVTQSDVTATSFFSKITNNYKNKNIIKTM